MGARFRCGMAPSCAVPSGAPAVGGSGGFVRSARVACAIRNDRRVKRGGANAAIRNVRRVKRGGGRSPAKTLHAERPSPDPSRRAGGEPNGTPTRHESCIAHLGIASPPGSRHGSCPPFALRNRKGGPGSRLSVPLSPFYHTFPSVKPQAPTPLRPTSWAVTFCHEASRSAANAAPAPAAVSCCVRRASPECTHIFARIARGRPCVPRRRAYRAPDCAPAREAQRWAHVSGRFPTWVLHSLRSPESKRRPGSRLSVFILSHFPQCQAPGGPTAVKSPLTRPLRASGRGRGRKRLPAAA